MMRNYLSRLSSAMLVAVGFGATVANAQPLDYYFPSSSTLQAESENNNFNPHAYLTNFSNLTFNEKITTPDEYLGYGVGDWHVRHDQLTGYLKLLAQQSDRIQLKVIGHTHERRQQLLLAISTPENIANLESLREQHVAQITDTSKTPSGPSFAYFGYSIHGNEPSGSNSSMLFAYFLAAAQSPELEAKLANTVVLLDPSFNPDGLDRFASWANANRGAVLSTDPNTREHAQAWPYARTNHYWFDLNRDWLLLQHPESRNRIREFHHWKPNLLMDYHEMGTNSTYFFQPGVPSRKHPLTPQKNVALTEKMATFHQKSFDAAGQLYFSEEGFDDFYYGKGSTYPDINGAVGILFEQASSRGHAQDSINGVLHFSETIRNQLTTSFTSFEASVDMRDELLSYQQAFYEQAQKEAGKDKVKGYVLSEAYDKTRLTTLLNLFEQHQIKVYPLQKDAEVDDKVFRAEHSYFVPLQQTQYRLIKAMFSTQKRFENNTFYDISSWTMPFAFNIDFRPVTSLRRVSFDENAAFTLTEKSSPKALPHAYAYAVSWDDYRSPELLQSLLANNLRVRVATKPFSARFDANSDKMKKFDHGTLLIPAKIQDNPKWKQVLTDAMNETGVAVQPLVSGSTEGIDLGSRSMLPLIAPKVMLVGGQGSSQYEVGEVWYYMDRYLKLAPSIVDMQNLASIDLSAYTHLVFVDGRYEVLGEAFVTKLKRWIKAGGVVIGQKGGSEWLSNNGLLNVRYVSTTQMKELYDTEGLPYGEQDKLASKQRIAGAIFENTLDLSHPLAYGYHNAILPTFKNNTVSFVTPMEPFVTVAKYTASPLLSGYADDTNVQKIASGSSIVAHSLGKGSVIATTDVLNFRGFWYGTSRIFSNAVYFGHLIDSK